MIVLSDVTQHYGIRPVLRGVNLRIERGEAVVILGPNGMGKSTLLRIMGGVLAPQHGFVEIDGLRRRRTVEEEIEIRRRAVYLPDKPWLPALRTGREFSLGVGRLYDIPDDRLMDHAQSPARPLRADREGRLADSRPVRRPAEKRPRRVRPDDRDARAPARRAVFRRL